jgi:hypothetical protein
LITTTDFNLAAARAAHAHLLRLRDGVRTQLIHAWLVENRHHPKARAVDALLSNFRFTGNSKDLDDAETFTDRHPGSAS